jgi:hypothetical protein
MPETDVFAEFVDAAPLTKSSFFLGRISSMIGLTGVDGELSSKQHESGSLKNC